MTDNVRRRFEKMIKRFSKLATPVNPFLLRILKTCAAMPLLLGIVTFATLLFSGCANGGYSSTSGQHLSASFHQQNTFGVGAVPQDSYFVDFTKPPSAQTGPTYPHYNGIGEP